MNVADALRRRRSVRGFRSDEVPAETLRAIFESAQRAPSWCNIQPWRVYLTSGDATRRVTSALRDAATEGRPVEPDHPWPTEYPDRYGELRKKCGIALYSAMGVERHDKAGRWDAWLRNYVGFDAPHLAFVGIDRRFGIYAAIDVGCWLQSVLLAATEQGVSTCSSAGLAAYANVIRNTLGIDDSVGFMFGIALGYEDEAVPANACRTDREPIEANITFYG